MTTESDKQAALEAALAQAKLNPSSANHWNEAAIAALQAAKPEAAVEYITQAIALEPQDALNYSNRGRINFALGQQQEALADYSRAVELAPSAELYASRSVVNVAVGRDAAALSDLTDAIELAPTADNYLNRAAFFARKSITGDALHDISQVIELQPDNPNHRLTRANLAFAAALPELGLSDIETAMRLDQNNSLQPGLLQLADQLELHLASSPQPDVSRRLIELIRGKQPE